jgi:hypothetical protein
MNNKCYTLRNRKTPFFAPSCLKTSRPTTPQIYPNHYFFCAKEHCVLEFSKDHSIRTKNIAQKLFCLQTDEDNYDGSHKQDDRRIT